MTKLHVFDMDGTLLRGAAVEEISRYLGYFNEASALEQAWRRGEIYDEPLFWDQVFELWSNASESDLDEAFNSAPWMERLADVFADIARRGEHSVVISQSPHFIVRRLEKWGAERTFATTAERGVPCQIDQLLQPADKVEITTRLVNEYGIQVADCVAYGDSTSDVDLFRALSATVAVNAHQVALDLATETYVGTDMWEAYQIGRTLLSERGSYPAQGGPS
ncbi:haloacid dehalogenase [Gordonia terrae]|uniref:phosphoserine phosphatase n=1 Tax=Gordonia terrae TaxID=2055 RepID=A0A2I1R4S8_9ACTN|nr:HAD-IB family phosphatase [Gordonia terrae]PKZ64135.1 haloacid dehalogenase [Gordonia terrae]